MFHVLIDTSVWLKLAQDHKLTPLLQVIEHMVRDKEVNLLVPRLVVDEFHRNKDRVLKESARSFTGHFAEVRKALAMAGGDKRKTAAVLSHLAEVNHKLPKLGSPAGGTLASIERLLEKANVIEPSDTIMLRAAARSLTRKAPCHRDKNSMADAVILETYLEAAKSRAAGQRFAFVTDNVHDFSVVGGNTKLPHPDFSASFSKIRSMYFTSLADCLRRISPYHVSEAMWFASHDEPRTIKELLDAHRVLIDQVWYNRHKHLAWQIERGKHKVVPDAEWQRLWQKDKRNHGRYTAASIWAGALRSAKRVEKRLGAANVGPWTDFEWGMINGKLSAVRWMMGDEWDMLDS